jgi:epsilon-lactone hydrolase
MSVRSELVRIGLRLITRSGYGPTASVEESRRRLAALVRWVPMPPPGTRRSWHEGDGIRVIRVARPESSDRRHILYFHGGAYVAGTPSLYRDFLWRIASAARAEVVCPVYRLAPEHPFPAAVDDAVGVYRWLLAQGVDARHTVLMGDSAGGGLVFGTLLRLRDEGAPLPAAAVGLSPWTDLALTGASIARNADKDVIVQARDMPMLAEHYLAGADPRTPYASPLYGDPTGLPPALIQVSDGETLLDDSVRLAERMRSAGCTVELEIWRRMPHVWQTWARLMPEARDAIVRIGEFVQQHCTSEATAQANDHPS